MTAVCAGNLNIPARFPGETVLSVNIARAIAEAFSFPGPVALRHGAPREAEMHINGYDHVGIRVTDRARALTFYEALGFRVDSDCSDERVAEIVNQAGVCASA